LRSKNRDSVPDLAPVLWFSFGTMAALLEEIVCVAPLIRTRAPLETQPLCFIERGAVGWLAGWLRGNWMAEWPLLLCWGNMQAVGGCEACVSWLFSSDTNSGKVVMCVQ
jgi:hypothetical protein